MSLRPWVDSGWPRVHQTSPQEIAGLLAIVDRDLSDAIGPISADWQFGIAYNAALKLCTVLLHSSGYCVEATLQHYRTIAAIPLILGDNARADALYLECCSKKRNTVEYNTVQHRLDPEDKRDTICPGCVPGVNPRRKVHRPTAPGHSGVGSSVIRTSPRARERCRCHILSAAFALSC